MNRYATRGIIAELLAIVATMEVIAHKQPADARPIAHAS